MLELGDHRIGIGLMGDRARLRGERSEVAIRALRQAIGEVDVDPQRPMSTDRPRRTESTERSGSEIAGERHECYLFDQATAPYA